MDHMSDSEMWRYHDRGQGSGYGMQDVAVSGKQTGRRGFRKDFERSLEITNVIASPTGGKMLKTM